MAPVWPPAEKEHEAEQIVANYTAAEERYGEAVAQIEQLQAALAAAQDEAAAARVQADRAQEQVCDCVPVSRGASGHVALHDYSLHRARALVTVRIRTLFTTPARPASLLNPLLARTYAAARRGPRPPHTRAHTHTHTHTRTHMYTHIQSHTCTHARAHAPQAQLSGEAMNKLRARMDKLSERRADLEAQLAAAAGKVGAGGVRARVLGF